MRCKIMFLDVATVTSVLENSKFETSRQLTWRHLSVKINIDQSHMVKIQDKQMLVANCEYSLQ